MDNPITKRSPCSVCGLDTFRHAGWFLVFENRWLDCLKILSWHFALASQKVEFQLFDQPESSHRLSRQ